MTVDELRPARLRHVLRPLDTPAGLTATAGARHSDFDLNGPAAMPERLKPAAVLVPLVARAEGYTVLLTQRTEHLQHHAGQVSFPGGRVEGDDTGVLGAALREAEEEIGLAPHYVQPMGLLDDYETVTRFLVTPVVSIVKPGFTLTLDAFEVADAFEVPLAFVLDPENHRIHSRIRHGERRRYYVFEYGDRYIWGATAGMLMNLYRRLHGLTGPTRPPPHGDSLEAEHDR
jgi:8-oxo-dGTP pyrophosphatase MutT (NUDIX family)